MEFMMLSDKQIKAHKFNDTYIKGLNLYIEGKKKESLKLFERSLKEIEPSDDIYIIKLNVGMREDIRKIIAKVKSEIK
jgi:hypothetical protein